MLGIVRLGEVEGVDCGGSEDDVEWSTESGSV